MKRVRGFSIRLSEEERERMRLLAMTLGVSMSEAIREAIAIVLDAYASIPSEAVRVAEDLGPNFVEILWLRKAEPQGTRNPPPPGRSIWEPRKS